MYKRICKQYMRNVTLKYLPLVGRFLCTYIPNWWGYYTQRDQVTGSKMSCINVKILNKIGRAFYLPSWPNGQIPCYYTTQRYRVLFLGLGEIFYGPYLFLYYDFYFRFIVHTLHRQPKYFANFLIYLFFCKWNCFFTSKFWISFFF